MFFLWLIFGLLIITVIIGFLIITSTIKIQIENFSFTLPKNGTSNKNLKIIIKLYLFGIIKILNINIDKTKMEKQTIRDDLSKISKKLKKNQNGFDMEFINVMKSIIKNINLEKLDLKIYLGVDDVALTAIAVGGVSGFIGFLLGIIENNSKYSNKQNRNIKNRKVFKVMPVYQVGNILKIDLDSIFAIKMRDIINIIYNLLKKRRVEENVRTSNRRSYAYSNE